MKILIELGALLGLRATPLPQSAVIDDGVLRPRTTITPDPLLAPARAGDLQFLGGYVPDQLLTYSSDVGLGALNTAHLDFFTAYLDRCQTPLNAAALNNIVDCEFISAQDKTGLFAGVLDRAGQHDPEALLSRIAKRPGLAEVVALVADRRQLGDALTGVADQYALDGQRAGYDSVRARCDRGAAVAEYRAKSAADVVMSLEQWFRMYGTVPDNLYRRVVYYADWLTAWAAGQHDLRRHYWALWAWSADALWPGSEQMQGVLDGRLNRDFVRQVMERVLPTQLATQDSDYLQQQAAVFVL